MPRLYYRHWLAKGAPAYEAWPRPRGVEGLGQRVRVKLFADYLDHDLAGAGVVQLYEEYALVGAELHGAVHNRHGLTGAQQQVLQKVPGSEFFSMLREEPQPDTEPRASQLKAASKKLRAVMQTGHEKRKTQISEERRENVRLRVTNAFILYKLQNSPTKLKTRVVDLSEGGAKGYYAGELAYYGYDAKAGYIFNWEASRTGSLTWDGTCPVASLPMAYLAMSKGSDSVLRKDSTGAWIEQYVATYGYHIDYYPTYGIDAYIDRLYYLTQTAPVTWSGSYYIP